MGISKQALGAVLALVFCIVALVPATGATGPIAGRADTIAVRVPAAAYDAAQQEGISPLRAIDYGAFVWLEIVPGDV